MSLLIDHLFVQKISNRLERFKRKSDSLYSFRCPLCGDSKTNKTKTRGYFYEKKGTIQFHCHNCNVHLSFSKFLKQIDSSLYREHLFENFKENDEDQNQFFEEKQITTENKEINLPKISDFSKKHIARLYCEKRKIPEKLYDNLYYADNFEKFVNQLLPNNDKEYGNEPRLIIPFKNEKDILVGFSGRDLLGNSKSKYLTVKINQDDIKYYHKEKLNFSKKIYVVEGPIDSMFLDNSIATMDSNLSSVIKHFNNADFVFIYDNEPRNSAIIRNMEKTIETGHDIFIWPSYINEKDINEMILNEYSNIHLLIDQNTFNGSLAKIKFTEWRKK